MIGMAYRLGLIGAGNMAEAIVKAAIDQGVLRPDQMIAADPAEARRQVLAQLGVATVDHNAEVLQQSEQVMLAVKPQKLAEPAADIARHGSNDQVLISILAGVGTGKLEEAIGGSRRIVRVMPNTPVMVGYGMAGIALGAHAQAGDEALTVQLFSAGGETVQVAEEQLDAITAVAGSGPAYVFYLAEAMEQAAADLGLGEQGAKLVTQTLLGGAHLLAESDQSAATLRQKVMSPGGTTEAAIQTLEARQVREAFGAAIEAAEQRSRALGS
jgi:pyrroline-5-carboxylate reductase